MAHAGIAEVVNGRLYVIDGQDAARNPTGAVRIYDPVMDSWPSGSPMPTAGFSPASGVIDGKIYVAGGQTPGFLSTDAMEAHDPQTDTWTVLAPMPGVRGSLGGGEIGRALCVFGGRLANFSPTGDAFPETSCYDTKKDAWGSGPDMITRRMEIASVEVGDAVYALGGRVGGGADLCRSSIQTGGSALAPRGDGEEWKRRASAFLALAGIRPLCVG